MSGEHRKALAKLLKGCSYRHNLYDVFRDFVEMAALSMSNQVDLIQAPIRETRYTQIVQKYEPDERASFPQMFAEFVMAAEDGPIDVLGSLFGELELSNARTGQFFTPFHVCRMMARTIVGDGEEMRALIKKSGFVTASEPAVGAGAQILALAEAMRSVDINYQQHLHVTAVDIDARAVHMAYLQLSLAHVPAVIVLGNTLTREEREHWRTPAHILGLWDIKLRRGYALGSEMDETEEIPEPTATAIADAVAPASHEPQLDLFGEAA